MRAFASVAIRDAVDVLEPDRFTVGEFSFACELMGETCELALQLGEHSGLIRRRSDLIGQSLELVPLLGRIVRIRQSLQ